MRIPTSVIVMSLLTAAPFGLAIRDTLQKKKDVASAEDELDFDGRGRARRERMRYEEEYERELAKEREESARKQAERLVQLDTLYGTAPASMGTLLTDIKLGADAGNFQPEAARTRIERATRDGTLNVSFDVDTKALNGVIVELSNVYDSDGTGTICDTLHEKIAEAWGRTSGSTWLDPATHQRATVDTNACSLTFDRYLETKSLVAALPFDAIGKSATKFADSLPSDAESDEVGALWSLDGIGLGSGRTKIEAFYAKGKVVAFKVVANTDFDSMNAIRDELSAKWKVNARIDDETGLWTWRHRPTATLEQLSNRFILVVGTIPWE